LAATISSPFKVLYVIYLTSSLKAISKKGAALFCYVQVRILKNLAAAATETHEKFLPYLTQHDIASTPVVCFLRH